MQGRANRFHGRREIKAMFRNGQILRGDGFNVRTSGPGHDRLAVVVSKKIHKNAVVRNRIRRRVAETIREWRRLKGSNKDLIVIVKDISLYTRSYPKLKQDLIQLLEPNQ